MHAVASLTRPVREDSAYQSRHVLIVIMNTFIRHLGRTIPVEVFTTEKVKDRQR